MRARGRDGSVREFAPREDYERKRNEFAARVVHADINSRQRRERKKKEAETQKCVRSREEMATDALSERLSSKLHLQTKTVGEERIKRAKEKDEDVAICSMFAMDGDPKFRCCLGKDCLVGDPKKADPGDDRSSRRLTPRFNLCRHRSATAIAVAISVPLSAIMTLSLEPLISIGPLVKNKKKIRGTPMLHFYR